MAIKTYTDLQQAVEAAAKQNFERDVWLDIVDEEDWEEEKQTYLDEARHILTTTGENYEPDFEEHDLIVLKNWRSFKPAED